MSKDLTLRFVGGFSVRLGDSQRFHPLNEPTEDGQYVLKAEPEFGFHIVVAKKFVKNLSAEQLTSYLQSKVAFMFASMAKTPSRYLHLDSPKKAPASKSPPGPRARSTRKPTQCSA